MFPDHLEAATINILFVKPASSVLGINIGLCGGLGDFWEMLKENGLEGFRKLELGFASSFEKRKSRNRTHFYPIRTFKELETKQKPDILEKIVQQISRLCFKPPNWKKWTKSSPRLYSSYRIISFSSNDLRLWEGTVDDSILQLCQSIYICYMHSSSCHFRLEVTISKSNPRDWLTLLEDMMKKDCVDLSNTEQVAQLLQRQKVFVTFCPRS